MQKQYGPWEAYPRVTPTDSGGQVYLVARWVSSINEDGAAAGGRWEYYSSTCRAASQFRSMAGAQAAIKRINGGRAGCRRAAGAKALGGAQ